MPRVMERRHDIVRSASRYVLIASFGVAIALSLGFYYADFRFESQDVYSAAAARGVEVVQIPATAQQQQQAAVARPQVPIEATSEAQVQELTIESTELYEQASVPVPQKLQEQAVFEEEAPPMEFWMVEKKPELVQQAIPEYPEIARQAGMEGDVYVEMVVGTDGHVQSVRIIRGPPVFHEAAQQAGMKMVFTPAMQNDRPVRVKVSQRISFRLRG